MRAWERVFRIAIVMVGGYLLNAALYLFDEGAASGLGQLPAVQRVVIPTVCVAWLGCLLARRLHREQRPGAPLSRRLTVAGTVALLGPFVVGPLITFARHPLLFAVCVPTTGFGLWAMYTIQRYRRVPVWLYLAVFAFGAIIAVSMCGDINELFARWSLAWYDTFSDDNHIEATLAVRPLRGINAGIVEELVKGAGVAIACLLARRHIDGAVSGAVLGAACGLGFNFTETILYMSNGDEGAAAQYFGRQIVGLLAAHTAFSAILGAAIGAAVQTRDRRIRRTAIICGALAAVGGHACYDAFNFTQNDLLPAVSDLVQLLVVLPASILLLQGPLIVMRVLLTRHGLRTQAAGLTTELWSETSAATAITPPEVPILLDPRQRQALHIAALRLHGIPAYRNLRRLHAAQLDLAAYRWHHTRAETTDGLGHDQLDILRDRIDQHKHRHAVLTAEAPR
ncbi:PrsW family intramembrane metalloprotease [Dactylosporangium siamense]|uniref:PrsW family intramembrane metalloprotease n=1 Tax=Dactylosporangium siamense TaxID=685454 RepID=A0A919PWH6_9ACTN|nr:PrsW family intramembrane metalloprotease [Dactylosporangium siamense]GIG49883.1 hypothetical protein Dsi01nite_079240 [Dactylosporangium siamense]